MYKVGDKVVYPHHGAGTVVKREKREVLGEKREYLTIKILHNDMTVNVPAENAERVGLRKVIDEEAVKKVVKYLTSGGTEMPKNWNRRFKHNRDKMKTGDIYELAEVVRNLALRDGEKGLSTGEKQMYVKAKKILASELMYAKTMSEDEALEWLEETLTNGAKPKVDSRRAEGSRNGRQAAPRPSRRLRRSPRRPRPRRPSPSPRAPSARARRRRSRPRPPRRGRRPPQVSVWAVLVAAGRGERLGEDRPKAFVRLGDLPLLAEPLRRLDECEWIDQVIVVAPPDWEEPAILLAEEIGASKVAACVTGGETRSDSVRAGVAEVPDDAAVILVHDAARPLVDDGRRAAADRGARAWLRRRRADAAGHRHGQARPRRRRHGDARPQRARHSADAAGLRRAVLRAALDPVSAKLAQATDCAALVEAAGGRVATVEGDERLLKVTTRGRPGAGGVVAVSGRRVRRRRDADRRDRHVGARRRRRAACRASR